MVVNVKVGDNFVLYFVEGVVVVFDVFMIEEGCIDGDFVFVIDCIMMVDGVYLVFFVSYFIGCVEYEDENIVVLMKVFFIIVISVEG